MRIKTQIMSALIPLFAGFALVMGGLLYYLQMREINWGLREEASSVAVTCARFASGGRIGADGVVDPAVAAGMRKIVAGGKVRSIVMFSADGRRNLLIYPTGVKSYERLLPPAGYVDVALDEACRIGNVMTEHGVDTLPAWAPVRGADGKLAGVVAVETDAEVLSDTRDELLRFLFVPLAGSILLGLVLALVISGLLTRRLAVLTRAVARVEGGKYDEQPDDGMVEELNDLVNTFETMRSVLKEVVSRRWRAVIEGEQFRTEDDLMCVFKARFQAPLSVSICGMDVSARLMGCRPVGAFFGAWEADGAGFAMIGKVKAEGVMEQTRISSAAETFIRHGIGKGNVQATIETAADMFDMAVCRLVRWTQGAGRMESWTLDTGAKRWVREELEMKPSLTMAFSTLDKHDDERIRAYLNRYSQLALSDLARELGSIVDARDGGAMLLLRQSNAA